MVQVVQPYQVRARRTTMAKSGLLLCENALGAYQFEHGAHPDSLNQLVPKYLAAVPADPHAERPLLYRRSDQSFLVYSVGPDGVDNGGKLNVGFDDFEAPGTDLALESWALWYADADRKWQAEMAANEAAVDPEVGSPLEDE
jgi:hypothetical protein